MGTTLMEKQSNDWDARTTWAVYGFTEAGYSVGEHSAEGTSKRRVLRWGLMLPVGEEENSYVRTQIIFPGKADRGALLSKLLSLRNRALQEGMRLLTADEVLEELEKRRRDVEHEANLY